MTPPLLPPDDELPAILVGPDSVTWRIASDVRLSLVMLYPLLLQVAHPTVGAGVRDFSDFDARPWDRLLRTLDYVCLLVYGGPQAAPAGRRLRNLHKRFKGTLEDGTRYHALEPGAYAWVHATLLESYLAGHAHLGRKLSQAERERFYDEYRTLGRLIGVRPGDLPPTLHEFHAYFDHTTQTVLTRTEAVDRVLGAVRRAQAPPIPLPNAVWRAARIPARRAMWLGGVGLLGPALRSRLQVPWSVRDEAQFRAVTNFSRGLTPLLPKALTVTGPAQLRWRTRAIARGPLATELPECASAPQTPTATPLPAPTSTRRSYATP